MADLATAMILLVTNGGAMKGGKVDLSKMRRSMSSCLSLILQPLSSSLSAAFRRARSMPSIKALAAAGALRQWWELRLGWIMTRKPYFTRALEMSVVVAAVLECHCLSTLRHVFYKGRVDVHRLLGRDGLLLGGVFVQDFRCDSINYDQNFNNGDIDANASCCAGQEGGRRHVARQGEGAAQTRPCRRGGCLQLPA
nr:uncharacterized protein LOC109786598 [Aegilops tauschii subsp. strangulata]XP_040258083.1 uncharacterized protein LOC120975529 [Aegilops tauschii subsp. strangulata]